MNLDLQVAIAVLVHYSEVLCLWSDGYLAPISILSTDKIGFYVLKDTGWTNHSVKSKIGRLKLNQQSGVEI